MDMADFSTTELALDNLRRISCGQRSRDAQELYKRVLVALSASCSRVISIPARSSIGIVQPREIGDRSGRYTRGL